MEGGTKLKVGLGTVAVTALAVAAAGELLLPRLVLYNGTGNEVRVTVDGETVQLGPYKHETRAWQIPGTVQVSAAPGFLDQDLESYEVHLGLGDGVVVYNVGGRGFLALDYIVYSNERAPAVPPSDLLGPATVQTLGRVDHVFRTPPKEKQISGSRQVDSQLVDVGHWDGLSELVDLTTELQGDQAGFEFAAAAALWDPQLNASSLVLNTFFADADSLVRAFGELGPHVALHRSYQDLAAPLAYDEVLQDYRDLARQHPDAALYQHLAARLEEPGSDEGLALALRATELDPRDAWAFSELAWHQVHRGELAEAARSMMSQNHLSGLRGARERYPETVRYALAAGDVDLARRALNKAQSPHDLSPDFDLAELEARLAPDKAGILANQLTDQLEKQDVLAGWPGGRASARTSICLAAGDLECATNALAQLGPEDAFQIADHSLLISLSDGQPPISLDQGLQGVVDLDHRGLVLAAAAAIRDGHPLEQQLRDATYERTALWPMLLDEVPLDDADALDAYVHQGASPEDWGHAYGAAALLIEAEGRGGDPVWQHARRQAVRWWLPDEGPHWELD